MNPVAVIAKIFATKISKDLAINVAKVILIAVFVIVIINEIKRLIPSSVVKQYTREINDRNLSYPETTYRTLASIIFHAAHGIGTDEDAIYRALSYLRNPDDWKKLVAVYGKDKDGFDLPGRLIYELDRREQAKVSDILYKIGVNF